MWPERSGPRTGQGARAENATGARGRHRQGSSRGRRPTVGDLGRADIEALAAALGAAYPGGAFPCLNVRCRARHDPFTPEHTRSAFVQAPTRARCFTCGTEFSFWRLRRAVLDDPRLARRLARVLEVAE